MRPYVKLTVTYKWYEDLNAYEVTVKAAHLRDAWEAGFHTGQGVDCGTPELRLFAGRLHAAATKTALVASFRKIIGDCKQDQSRSRL